MRALVTDGLGATSVEESGEWPCRRADPDAWFSTNPYRQAEAAQACHQCPAQELCLRAALDLEGSTGKSYRFGVWGGHTPEDRARIARARRRLVRA
ncbi:WhiB family transcriptional regulator [Micrococcus luteus]|nr:WhiB family transcriptional regulator [Micrococcus luteus]